MTTVEHAASARELLERHGRAIAEARSEGELLLGTLHRASSMANPPPFASAVALGRGGPRAIAAQVLGPRAHVLATGGAERITELAPALAAHTGELASVVGPTADVSVFADAWVAHTGCASRPARTMLAYELRAVENPPRPPGEPRVAGAADEALAARWAAAFDRAVGNAESHRTARVRELIAAGDLMLWVDKMPVAMAAVVRRTPRSASIALVYTPADQRRRGYASALVAVLSRRELDAGRASCSLFTDAANPTTNRIYRSIGYEPRSEFCEITFLTPTA